MTHDSGFAPHVANGILTLATCKPRIRKSASADVHDYIMGIGGMTLSKSSGKDVYRKLIYLAEVTDKIDFDAYYRGRGYRGRKDNIYHRISGRWMQDKNEHHGDAEFKRDIDAPMVLVSRRFIYFGRRAIGLDEELFERFARMSRRHKVTVLDRNGSNQLERLFTKYRTRLNKSSKPCLSKDGRHLECKSR